MLLFLLLHLLLDRLRLLGLIAFIIDRGESLAKSILASFADIAILSDGAFDHGSSDWLGFTCATEDAEQVFDALGLRVIDLLLLSLLLDLLNLDLTQLDLVQLTFLLLLLLNDNFQVIFADLTISVLLQHSVLALDIGDLALLLIDDLLLVVPLLDQVLVDHLDRCRGHLLLLLSRSGGELVDDLLVALLELLVVLNLRIKILDNLLLDLIAHGEVALVGQSCITIEHDIYERRHEAAHPSPEVFRLCLGLGQLRR